MQAQATPTPRRLARAAALFAVLGLLLYGALYVASEQLMLRQGHANPFFRIATAQQPADWIVLGASHAMPLDFGDSRAAMERATGQRLLNLSSPGTGPLYNRFVLEQVLRRGRPPHVLYVVDSFAFQSQAWNEDRFADPKLLARTPWDAQLAGALGRYVRREGVDWRAWASYVTGFAKINNRDRFERDRWEGELQFDRTWRPSESAVKKRIAYLYPAGPATEASARYLAQFEETLGIARRAGAKVFVIKPPLPAAYRSRLPDETGFDAAIAAAATRTGATYVDFSATLDDPRFYFDSDHLNRAGVAEFFARSLRGLLAKPAVDKPA